MPVHSGSSKRCTPDETCDRSRVSCKSRHLIDRSKTGLASSCAACAGTFASATSLSFCLWRNHRSPNNMYIACCYATCHSLHLHRVSCASPASVVAHLRDCAMCQCIQTSSEVADPVRVLKQSAGEPGTHPARHNLHLNGT